MSDYFEVNGDDTVLRVNDDYKNYFLVKKVQLTIGSSNWVQYSDQTTPYTSSLVVAFRPVTQGTAVNTAIDKASNYLACTYRPWFYDANDLSKVGVVVGVTNTATYGVTGVDPATVAWGLNSLPNGTVVDCFIFDVANSRGPQSSGFGVEVYNAAGEVMFTTAPNTAPMSVAAVIDHDMSLFHGLVNGNPKSNDPFELALPVSNYAIVPHRFAYHILGDSYVGEWFSGNSYYSIQKNMVRVKMGYAYWDTTTNFNYETWSERTRALVVDVTSLI